MSNYYSIKWSIEAVILYNESGVVSVECFRVSSKQSHHDTVIEFILGFPYEEVCLDWIVKSHQSSSNHSPQTLTESTSMCYWIGYVRSQRHDCNHKSQGPTPPYLRTRTHQCIHTCMHTCITRTIVEPGVGRKNSITSSDPQLISPKNDRERRGVCTTAERSEGRSGGRALLLSAIGRAGMSARIIE